MDWASRAELLTGAAWVGRLEELAVWLDGGTQRQRLVVEVDALYGVGETEVGQDDVEQPAERLGGGRQADARALQHVRDHHSASHCSKQLCRTSLRSDQNLRGPHVARQQQLSIDSAIDTRPQQKTRRPPLLLSIDGTDGRTDGRTIERFMTLGAYYSGPVWVQERCRISPPRFLAECCKRQLNQRSFVLLYFRLFTFSDLH